MSTRISICTKSFLDENQHISNSQISLGLNLHIQTNPTIQTIPQQLAGKLQKSQHRRVPHTHAFKIDRKTRDQARNFERSAHTLSPGDAFLSSAETTRLGRSSGPLAPPSERANDLPCTFARSAFSNSEYPPLAPPPVCVNQRLKPPSCHATAASIRNSPAGQVVFLSIALLSKNARALYKRAARALLCAHRRRAMARRGSCVAGSRNLNGKCCMPPRAGRFRYRSRCAAREGTVGL